MYGGKTMKEDYNYAIKKENRYTQQILEKITDLNRNLQIAGKNLQHLKKPLTIKRDGYER